MARTIQDFLLASIHKFFGNPEVKNEVRRIASTVTTGGGADLTSVNNAVSALQDRVSTNSATAAAIATNVTSLASDVGRVSLNVSAISTAVAANSANVTSVAARVDTVSANQTSLASDVGRISTAAAANTANITSLGSDVGRISTNHVSLVSDISRISLNVSAMSTTVANASANITSLASDVGRISLNASAISTRLDTVSNQVSVISAGLGGMQMKVVGTEQSVVSANLVKISGLSLSVAANGIYQIEGQIMMGASALSAVGFAMSLSAATIKNAAGRWMGNFSVANNVGALYGYWNDASAFGSTTYSVGNASLLSANQNFIVELNGIVALSTAGGTIQLKSRNGLATGVLVVRPGSFIRAYKLG